MQTLIDFSTVIYQQMQPWLPLLASISILMMLASMIFIPILIVKMPANYFVANRRMRHWTITRVTFYVLRNIAALVLLVAGLIMLVLPGQGLLTIIIAVMVSDMPGKYRFERFLVRHRGVVRSMNWIRKRYEKEPLQVPRKNREP